MSWRKDRVATALLVAVSAFGVVGLGNAYATDNRPQPGSKEWCDGMLKIYNSYLDTAGEEAKRGRGSTAELYRLMAANILSKARAAGCAWVKDTIALAPASGDVPVPPPGSTYPPPVQ